MRRIVCPARRHQNPAAQQKDTLTAREKGAHAAPAAGGWDRCSPAPLSCPGSGHHRPRGAREQAVTPPGCQVGGLHPAPAPSGVLGVWMCGRRSCMGGEAAGVQGARDLGHPQPSPLQKHPEETQGSGALQEQQCPQKGHAAPTPSPPAAEAGASCCRAAPSGHCPAEEQGMTPNRVPPGAQLRSGHRQLWRWRELSPPRGQSEQDSAVLPTVRHAPTPSFLATLRPWRCAARGHAPRAPPQAAPEETGWEKLHLAAEQLLFPL